MRNGLEQARTALCERLRARLPEIEQTALTRIHAISDPAEVADPEYAMSLQAAIHAALEYGISTIEQGEERAPPVPAPVALLAQARFAARRGVSLDTVLRRYFAGYTLLGDYLIDEAERSSLLGGAELKRLLRTQASLFDRLLGAVSEEYGREVANGPHNSEKRKAERIERLLAGELIGTSELAYEFDGVHLGLVGSGSGVAGAIRDLASTVGHRLLLTDRGDGVVWAWLGSRRQLDSAELDALIDASWPGDACLALGEPSEGLAGWRLSHRQAKAALPIALRGPDATVRYANVTLLASILQDDLLATSLRRLFLAPIERERNGGKTARKTLSAYFNASRNVSSAAAALGVSRRTVSNRLSAIEERLGRPLDSVAPEIEMALRLDRLQEPSLPGRQ